MLALALLLSLAAGLSGCGSVKQALGLQPKTAAAKAATPRYCYRTLARIDCYDTPDPHASDISRIR
jgi:hypothetical protein